jgi:hypothetical protein
LKPSLLGGGAE